MNTFELKHPELLIVEDEYGAKTVGGSQDWYPKKGFIPPGACGAATASNVLAYILRSRPELYAIAAEKGPGGLSPPLEDIANNKAEYLEFMKKVYSYFRPCAGGLMSDAFAEGVAALSLDHGLPVGADCLRVSVARAKRPGIDEITAFLQTSLSADIPAAFLILSAGRAEGLENWHWVTIVAYDAGAKQVKIVDNGNVFWTDIGLWLDTSIMGGSFVRLVL